MGLMGNILKSNADWIPQFLKSSDVSVAYGVTKSNLGRMQTISRNLDYARMDDKQRAKAVTGLTEQIKTLGKSGLKGDDLSKATDSIRKRINDYSAIDRRIAKRGQDAVVERYQGMMTDAANAVGYQAKNAPKTAWGYMTAADHAGLDTRMGTALKRGAVVGGAYGGLALGTRALTGGSATTNNQGQSDIAGIPFI